MTEIRAHSTINAQPSTKGDDSSSEQAALPDDHPASTTSPTQTCAGLSNPFDQNSFIDDGYVSDGTLPSFFPPHGRELTLLPAKTSTMATRLKKALRLAPNREEPDFKMEQIIKSRESGASTYSHVSDKPNLVDDYNPGYGKVAAIEDLDADFLVFRKFGWLHKYALLHLQDELAQQQYEIESFDKWEFKNGDPTKLVSRRKDHAFRESRRKELVGKLHVKLAQYGGPSVRQSRYGVHS